MGEQRWHQTFVNLWVAKGLANGKNFVVQIMRGMLSLGKKVATGQLNNGTCLGWKKHKETLKLSFGIVVLSQAFFQKHWPQYELDGLAAREVRGKKVILPIWHGVSYDDVVEFSPPLADRVAASSASPLREVVRTIIEAVSD